MDGTISRRDTLKSIGLVAAAAGMVAATEADAAGPERAPRDYLPPGATRLRRLYRRLAGMPRRRGATELPMVLTKPRQWDAEPFAALLAYDGGPRHVFDATDLTGTWLTQIRNTLNAEVFAFDAPDFHLVAAPHGQAGYSLLPQWAWKKYGLAALTGGNPPKNENLADPEFKRSAIDDLQARDGLYSEVGGTIPVLQKRGVVFCACHNALWELAYDIIHNGGRNPDGRNQRGLVADLIDALIPGVVVTPGNEAVIGRLQRAGFSYSFAQA